MWAHPIMLTLLFFIVSGLVIIIMCKVFDFLTPAYSLWKEIAKGNLAVALALGGKIIGLALILHQAIAQNDTIWQTLGWSSLGIVMLLVAYYVFELITPNLNVNQELLQDNRAVGIVVMSLFIALGWIASASIL